MKESALIGARTRRPQMRFRPDQQFATRAAPVRRLTPVPKFASRKPPREGTRCREIPRDILRDTAGSGGVSRGMPLGPAGSCAIPPDRFVGYLPFHGTLGVPPTIRLGQ